MNNKDPFENFLKNQGFKEKASESLRMKLEKGATWNQPWWKNLSSLITMVLILVVAVGVLFVITPPPVEQTIPRQSEEQPLHSEPEESPKVIALNGDKEILSPLQRQFLGAEPEFNLSFIDRPVNFINARREYADLI